MALMAELQAAAVVAQVPVVAEPQVLEALEEAAVLVALALVVLVPVVVTPGVRVALVLAA